MTSYKQHYIAAKKRHREREAAKIGKTEVSASGIEFYRPLGGGWIDHPGVPNRVDRWRQNNPGVVTRWQTAGGGYVTQMWDARIYRGECVDCGDLVTRTRYIGGMSTHDGKTWIGDWPKYCDGCRGNRENKHDDGAAARMRKLRQERREERDYDYTSRGLEPPRQGVAGDPLPPSWSESEAIAERELRDQFGQEDRERAERFQSRRGLRSPYESH